MLFGPQKNEYVAAVEELLALMQKVEIPVRDSIATLERMKRLRFASRMKESEVAAQVREAVRILTPVVEAKFDAGLAAQFRRSEAIAKEG